MKRLLTSIILLLCGTHITTAQAPPSCLTGTDTAELSSELHDSTHQGVRSLEHMIGQLLVVGFIGTEPSQEVIDAVGLYSVGGVILFDANVSEDYGERNIRSVEQTRKLTDSLQTLARGAGIPRLIIAIDQEGGRVNRLKSGYGFPHSRSAWYLGNCGSIDSTLHYGELTARTLASVGININYAPCVDLASNIDSPAIGRLERAYSANYEEVARHAEAWVETHHRHGILTSLKHFPGHGSATKDSHYGLTNITSSWNKDELKPYQAIIEQGYNDIVMVGHLFNSHIDDKYPASLSRATVDILRSAMSYNGVIATDDMNMGAIVNNYSYERALELALNAGVDMIIIGNNAKHYEADLVSRTVKIIWNLVESGKVSRDRIEEAYGRIMALKRRLN